MKKALSFFLTLSLAFVLFAGPVLAQDIGLEYGKASGLGNQDVRITAVQIINVLLGLIGVICTALMVYAGFNWMTAAGNEEQIEKAKKTMRAAVIGLAIVLSAWTITSFVLDRTYYATTANQVQLYP